MELSKTSFKTRVLCGMVLLVVGYIPTLLNFLPSQPSAINACRDHSVGCLDELLEKNINSIDHRILTTFWESSGLRHSPSEVCFGGDFLPCMPLVAHNSDSVSDVNLNIPSSREVKVIPRGTFAGSLLVKGKIQSNFYVEARLLGVPVGIVDRVISNLSQKIDFRRFLKKGDQFEVLYSPRNELLFARISSKRGKVAVYRFSSGNNIGYYFDNGAKVDISKKNSFGSPLMTSLRVSSHFGYRRHPIHGRWANHTGVDFYAVYGAPVHAIFDGVVTRASYYRGYGHCVDIKHQSGYTSRYAHLSGYNVRSGATVKKGQMIGRVGSSGTSTGSHLHLELARNNKTLNPLSVKMIPSDAGIVPNMKSFMAYKSQIDLLVAK